MTSSQILLNRKIWKKKTARKVCEKRNLFPMINSIEKKVKIKNYWIVLWNESKKQSIKNIFSNMFSTCLLWNRIKKFLCKCCRYLSEFFACQYSDFFKFAKISRHTFSSTKIQLTNYQNILISQLFFFFFNY